MSKIRNTGYATSFDEFFEGVTTIAAPIFDYQGKVIAALSVVGPKQRIQTQKVPGYAKKVIALQWRFQIELDIEAKLRFEQPISRDSFMKRSRVMYDFHTHFIPPEVITG